MLSFLQRLAPAHARLVRAGLAVTGMGALCAACSPVEYTQDADCRPFVQPITVNGKQETRYTTQCRQADGSWKVIAQADSGTTQTAQAGQAPSGQVALPTTLPPLYPYNPTFFATAPYPYPYNDYDPWPGYYGYGPGYGLGFVAGGFGPHWWGPRGRGFHGFGFHGGGFHGGGFHGGGGHGGGGHR
jgi:uncharacterized membrane protein YgcG